MMDDEYSNCYICGRMKEIIYKIATADEYYDIYPMCQKCYIEDREKCGVKVITQPKDVIHYKYKRRRYKQIRKPKIKKN